jgi:hypothetical protein
MGREPGVARPIKVPRKKSKVEESYSFLAPILTDRTSRRFTLLARTIVESATSY